MSNRNPQKTLQKNTLKPASALRFRVDDAGLLRARVSASAGEFNLSPELIHLLCLLQMNVRVSQLEQKLKQDFQAMLKHLPNQDEIESLIEEMRDAQCIINKSQDEHIALGVDDGFGDPWIQWAMLADKPRCEAYQRAIKASVSKESCVLDVGAGTGLLSIFALEAGARQVDAIEETASVKILQKVKNALPAQEKQRLYIHNRNSADVKFSNDVTHVVSELFGNDPLQEGVMSTLHDVFSRLNSDKVTGIPESLEILVQAADVTTGPLKSRLEHMNMECSKQLSGWSEAVSRIQKHLNFETISFAHPVRKSDLVMHGSGESVFRIALAPPPGPTSPRPKGSVKVKFEAQAKCPIILLCFRAHLSKNMSISNLPGSSDQCDHWSPIVVPIKRHVSKNEVLQLSTEVHQLWERIMLDIKDSQGKRIGSRQ